MVGCQIEEDADRGAERRREIDLIGGAFHDIVMFGRRLGEGEDRNTDIAAELGVTSGCADAMGDQGRRGRFAVGAGDGDERRQGGLHRALAAENFHVANDLGAGPMGKIDCPMGLGMGQGDAWRQNEAFDPCPVDLP